MKRPFHVNLCFTLKDLQWPWCCCIVATYAIIFFSLCFPPISAQLVHLCFDFGGTVVTSSLWFLPLYGGRGIGCWSQSVLLPSAAITVPRLSPALALSGRRCFCGVCHSSRFWQLVSLLLFPHCRNTLTSLFLEWCCCLPCSSFVCLSLELCNDNYGI